MKRWIIGILAFLLVMFSFVTIKAEEEIVFEPISSGNFAILHLNDEEIFLINTGDSASKNEVMKYLNKLNDKKIKGILITKIIKQNCGNMKTILENYEISNIYMPQASENECDIPNEKKNIVYHLNDNDQIAISSKFYIEYMKNQKGKPGNFAISNGDFVCFWYEGSINYENWDKKVQVIFLPDSPVSDNLSENELVKLDPEVAIINQRNELDSLIELFQKQWVDIYSLRRGASAHIIIVKNEYDLYLKKE